MNYEKMKEIRTYFDNTQKQLADYLNVSRSTYAGWENGIDSTPLLKLNEFCNYYKISIDYITGLSKKNNYIYSGDSIDLNRVAKNLRKLRIDNNLKQRDIFNMLNITSSSYSVYETEQTLIQTSLIYQIAKKYKASIDSILKEQ